MDTTARTLKDQAAQWAQKGKYKKALGAYLEIGRIEHDNPRWPHKAGEMQQKMGQTDQAIVSFQEASWRYAEQGFMLKAISLCNMILGLDPGHTETQTMLADFYARHREPRQVIGTPPPEPSVAQGPALAPGASLDSVRLGQVVSGARPYAAADAASQVFVIPLEEEAVAIPLEEEAVADEADEPRLSPTPLFSMLDRDSLQSLIEKVQVKKFMPGDRIITQGTAGDTLYVLVEGEAVVYREGPPRVEVNRMTEGAFFGEIALITSFERTSTVEVVSDSTVMEISRRIISELVEEHPSVLKVLLRFFRDRLINTLVESSRMFSSFTPEKRQELASHFTFIEAEAETLFAQQGQPADGLYILLSGQLDISPPASWQGPGYLFGVGSLLSGDNETTTVRARTRCWLLKMDRQGFKEAILTYPHVMALISELSEKRQQRSGPRE